MRSAARLPRDIERRDQGRTLERLLRQHGAELLARKHCLRDELPAEGTEVKDAMEHCVDHLERGVGAALLEVASWTVRGIESALRRLEAGTYGVCADCGREIPSARLKALPFAERCCDCQRERDGSRAALPAPAGGGSAAWPATARSSRGNGGAPGGRPHLGSLARPLAPGPRLRTSG
jgi:DnaK suppressor protein